MKKSIVLSIIFTIIGSIAFAAGGGEGDFTFYAAVDEEHAAMIAQEFEKASGIKTSFVRMSSGEGLARLKAEKNNMTASAWYGGPIDSYIAAAQEGIIDNYVSPEAKNVRAEFLSEDGTWSGIYVGYLGFVGNKKLLAEKGLSMPQSWDDLLQPGFKNEVVVAHPGSSGTAYTMLSTVVQLKGEEAAMEYFKKFNGQVRQYTKSGSAPARMIGQGEATVGIVFLHDAIKFKKQGFEDIVISAPQEGTGFEIGGLALLKGAPNPEAAKAFIDWSLTKEVQELGRTVGSFQFLTNNDALPPEEAQPIKDTKLIDYDFEWAGTNRVRLVEKFSEATSTVAPTK